MTYGQIADRIITHIQGEAANVPPSIEDYLRGPSGYIAEAVRSIVRESRLWLFRERFETTLTAGTHAYQMRTLIPRVHIINSVSINDGSIWASLSRIMGKGLESTRFGYTTGRPYAWGIVGKEILFDPRPTANDSILIDCYRFPEALPEITDTFNAYEDDISQEAPDVIIYRTCIIVAAVVQDPEQEGLFTGLYNKSIRELKRQQSMLVNTGTPEPEARF